jgi:bifunctional non-homologous end joining protein LigD
MFHKACELHAEGIVSKQVAAKYGVGRSGAWLKSKCLHEQEFVVGGYTLPAKGGRGIGALLLGYYEDGKLVYAGRVGTGFSDAMSTKLRAQLERMATKATAFVKLTADAKRGALWVRPDLVAQVRFATWTADEQVRQAAFLGLREDKAAEEVRREGVDVAPRPKGTMRAVKASVPVKVAAERAPVRLTHPDKVLDAESGVTKQQLADYYWAVSERMLPHLLGRAVSLVRVPDGIGKQAFYQKHVTASMPDGFVTVDVPDKKTGVVEKYVGVKTREAIASLAQMAVLEVHPWGSLAKDLERPDRLVFDLDPDEALAWTVLRDSALEVRARLKKLGLESFVKTTGGKGLHVVVPILPDMEWPAAKEFCRQFVLGMEKDSPKLYLTKMTKAARVGKIYLDYLRNERGATAVAPYSSRARAGLGVAMPLEWPELQNKQRPVYRVGEFAGWRERLREDPWAKMLEIKQRVKAKRMV